MPCGATWYGPRTMFQVPDWTGPGLAYSDSYGEMTQRAWYGAWLDWMSR